MAAQVEVAEHPVPHPGGQGEGGGDAEEPGGGEEAAAAVGADLAPVGVAGHPLAPHRREPAVPVGQDLGQLGALLPPRAGHQQGAQRPLDLVLEPADQHVGVAGAHADGVAQVLAVEALAHVEVEDHPVPGAEAVGGGGDQGGQVAARVGVGRDVGRVGVGGGHLDVVQRAMAGPPFDGPQAAVAGDGVEPGPQAVGVAQLVEAGAGHQERVLEGVGGLVRVPQQGAEEVVDPGRVAVVDGRERLAVTVHRLLDERGVVHPGMVRLRPVFVSALHVTAGYGWSVPREGERPTGPDLTETCLSSARSHGPDPMTWHKLRSLQEVEITVDGHVHRVLAAEWDDETGAVKVLWPPGAAAFASQSHREVADGDYEPTDYYSFPGGFF